MEIIAIIRLLAGYACRAFTVYVQVIFERTVKRGQNTKNRACSRETGRLVILKCAFVYDRLSLSVSSDSTEKNALDLTLLKDCQYFIKTDCIFAECIVLFFCHEKETVMLH